MADAAPHVPDPPLPRTSGASSTIRFVGVIQLVIFFIALHNHAIWVGIVLIVLMFVCVALAQIMDSTDDLRRRLDRLERGLGNGPSPPPPPIGPSPPA